MVSSKSVTLLVFDSEFDDVICRNVLKYRISCNSENMNISESWNHR